MNSEPVQSAVDQQKTPVALSPAPRPTPPASPARLLKLGVGLGVVLTLGGILWAVAQQDVGRLGMWFAPKTTAWWSDIGLGLVVGGLFAGGLWIVGRYIEGFKAIRERIAAVLDLTALRGWHIVVLSLVAAVPEEIFFRGAMQPALGLLVTSLIFGALHAITPLYFVYAALASLGLGLLRNWNDALLVPMAAHFAVDVVSLGLLRHWAIQRTAGLQTGDTQLSTEEEPPSPR